MSIIHMSAEKKELDVVRVCLPFWSMATVEVSSENWFILRNLFAKIGVSFPAGNLLPLPFAVYLKFARHRTPPCRIT